VTPADLAGFQPARRQFPREHSQFARGVGAFRSHKDWPACASPRRSPHQGSARSRANASDGGCCTKPPASPQDAFQGWIPRSVTGCLCRFRGRHAQPVWKASQRPRSKLSETAVCNSHDGNRGVVRRRRRPEREPAGRRRGRSDLVREAEPRQQTRSFADDASSAHSPSRVAGRHGRADWSGAPGCAGRFACFRVVATIRAVGVLGGDGGISDDEEGPG
jgi:hypothetical protein